MITLNGVVMGSLLLATAAIAGNQRTWVPQEPEHIVCKRGTLEPYVPNTATAKAIFSVVEAAIDPTVDKKRYPSVDVLERGGRWLVFRHNASTLDEGQLEMEISKCTARIYRVGRSG